MANRVTLKPDLPPQTDAFKRFEKAIVELNHFYWTFKCALEHMIPAMSTVQSVPELLKGKSARQLNISSSQFLTEVPETERVARHSLLVLSVTSFEDYLKESLTTFLIKNWKMERTYKVSFRPQDLPSPQDTHDWLRQKSIQSVVNDILGRAYDKRFEAIAQLVNDYGADRPGLEQEMRNLAVVACEARNCIVHSSSVADERTAIALASIIPGIAKGASLDVSEDILWKFLGALRDSARSLDVQLRKTP
jgi:hypothetical protein